MVGRRERKLLAPYTTRRTALSLRLLGIECLLTDCDKLRRLDTLLFQLKRDGHRVLIYSQMTKMLDLLEVCKHEQKFL